MTVKVLQRDTCPAPWYLGCQMRWQGEIIELAEIESDQYTWMDVEELDYKRVINE